MNGEWKNYDGTRELVRYIDTEMAEVLGQMTAPIFPDMTGDQMLMKIARLNGAYNTLRGLKEAIEASGETDG